MEGLLENCLQGFLEKVVDWCNNKDNMKMNVSKSKLTTFNNRPNEVIVLHTPEGDIGSTTSYKYLGVWLDRTLNVERYLNNGYKMAYQKAVKLKKLRK